MPKVPLNDIPAILKPYMVGRGKQRKLKGIFVRGCIERGTGSSFRRRAHAHIVKSDPYRGWICVRAEWRLSEEQLMLHELAHILTNQGHTDKWRETAESLGYKTRWWESKEYFYCRRKGFRPYGEDEVANCYETLLKQNKTPEGALLT